VRALSDHGFTEYIWGLLAGPIAVAYVRQHGAFHIDWIVADPTGCRRLPRHASRQSRPPYRDSRDLVARRISRDMARAVSGLTPSEHTEMHPIPAACRLPMTQPTTVRPPRTAI